MSVYANTPLRVRPERADDFGPDRLSDPDFVPCRDECCTREDLHRAHETNRPGRKAWTGYRVCPQCQTPVVVNKAKRKQVGGKRVQSVVTATCPACGWFHTKTPRASKDG